MTAPAARPRLTRHQAFGLLAEAGFPSEAITTQIGLVAPLRVVLVATAEMESDLHVDAQGPPNSNGTVDRGWLQINAVHGFDADRLLTDPLYTAECAYDIYARQGVKAWSAYGRQWPAEDPPYRYLRRMPPGYGGAPLIPNPPTARQRTDQRELTRSVQQHLNSVLPDAPRLTADGVFGRGTRARLLVWKRAHHNDGHDRIDARAWMKMTAQGLR